MADNQIQYKWAKHRSDNYGFMMVAVNGLRPRPDVSLSIKLSGDSMMPEHALSRISQIAAEHGFKMLATLTMTWDDDENAPDNLRLVPFTSSMFSDADFQKVAAEPGVQSSVEADWQKTVEGNINKRPECEHQETITDPGSGRQYCSECGDVLPLREAK